MNKNEKRTINEWRHINQYMDVDDILKNTKVDEYGSNSNNNEYTSILPIASRVFSKIISQDLVSVQPMQSPVGIDQKKLEELKSTIQSENREGTLNSVLTGEKYVYKVLEDDDRYKSLLNDPSITSKLFYIDYTYNTK